MLPTTGVTRFAEELTPTAFRTDVLAPPPAVQTPVQYVPPGDKLFQPDAGIGCFNPDKVCNDVGVIGPPPPPNLCLDPGVIGAPPPRAVAHDTGVPDEGWRSR